jgi:hypothetical protein
MYSVNLMQRQLAESDVIMVGQNERHTALLSHCHPLSLGQLYHLHAEHVHELSLCSTEDLLEQACMRPKYFSC